MLMFWIPNMAANWLHFRTSNARSCLSFVISVWNSDDFRKVGTWNYKPPNFQISEHIWAVRIKSHFRNASQSVLGQHSSGYCSRHAISIWKAFSRTFSSFRFWLISLILLFSIPNMRPTWVQWFMISLAIESSLPSVYCCSWSLNEYEAFNFLLTIRRGDFSGVGGQWQNLELLAAKKFWKLYKTHVTNFPIDPFPYHVISIEIHLETT